MLGLKKNWIMKFIIVEGGGFKTGFTSGVVDAFIANDYNPFDGIIGISGGAVVVSYYLSKQFKYCLNAMKILAKDKEFTKFRRTFGEQGYMNINVLSKVASLHVPFAVEEALKYSESKHVYFVATNKQSGEAAYLKPQDNLWIDKVVASCTLPFVTKGSHEVNGKHYFDGGWGDGLPIKWAYKMGAKEIIIVRTHPIERQFSQSWMDYFASIYYKSTPNIQKAFASACEKYNDNLRFLLNPPPDLNVIQIAPSKALKSGTYSYSIKTIMRDYRYGLDKGLKYINSIRI